MAHKLARLFGILFIAFLLCLLRTPSLLAQAPRDIPSDAGIIQEKLKKSLEDEFRKKFKERVTRPEPEEPPIEVEDFEQPEVPPLQFELQEISFEGNTLIPSGELAALLQGFQGRMLGAKELEALVEVVEMEYRRRGYVTTVAYLPPQRIEEGRVTIAILEGRVGKVIVEGNEHFTEEQILKYWLLDPGQPLQYDEIRRGLNRMNDHPDRDVRALLRPGETTGTTDVVLKVSDEFPFHASGRSDHEGTKTIGPFRYAFSLSHNNLLGWDDRATGGVLFGRDFGSGYLQYVVPLNATGTSMNLGFSHSQSAPKGNLKGFGVNGTSQTYSVGVSHVILEDERMSLRGTAGLAFKDDRTKVESGTSRRDRLRVFSFGPDLRVFDASGGWFIQNQWSFGIDGLGATSERNPTASRIGAVPDFMKVGFTVTRVQRLPGQATGIITLGAQLSPSKMVPREEFYLGGANTVRGYPEGDFLADQGFYTRFEYRVPFEELRKSISSVYKLVVLAARLRVLPDHWQLPGSEEPMQDQFQVSAFLDQGYGRLRGAADGERKTRNLLGIGTGLLFRFDPALSAKVEVAFSVGDPPLTDDPRHIIHFTIASDF